MLLLIRIKRFGGSVKRKGLSGKLLSKIETTGEMVARIVLGEGSEITKRD
jgi:hypothetical protein